MHSLPDLIAHWRRREADCGKEIGQIVSRYNANYHEAKSRGSTVSDDDLRRMTKGWREDQAIARDTASWLETMLNHRIGQAK